MKTLCSAFIFFLCFNVNAQLPSACDSTESLNLELLKVVQSCIGKKIDRGECWDLVKYGLDKVGANWDGYLNYGKKIDWKKVCIQPGDILQFEGVVFKGQAGNVTYTDTYFHHTAIVHAVKPNGEVELIHQNTGQFGKKVGVSSIYFKDLKKGKIEAYRPIK